MIKADVYNSEGKKMKDVVLAANLFEVPMKENFVWHALDAAFSNVRRSTAQTTDKGERRGGGKKPWKQKGTGRARHGSIRSPLWRKGGVTFGPTTDINHHKKLNKKARRKALGMILSDKAREKRITILHEYSLKEAKTKFFIDVLRKLPLKGEHILILTSGQNEKLFKAQKNIPYTKAIRAEQLTLIDAAAYDWLLIEEKALALLEKTFHIQPSRKAA